MGIKNIHIALIVCSVSIAGIFGNWALNNDYKVLGGISILLAIGLIVYGVSFLKKAKNL